jgi:hypothetical protein
MVRHLQIDGEIRSRVLSAEIGAASPFSLQPAQHQRVTIEHSRKIGARGSSAALSVKAANDLFGFTRDLSAGVKTQRSHDTRGNIAARSVRAKLLSRLLNSWRALDLATSLSIFDDVFAAAQPAGAGASEPASISYGATLYFVDLKGAIL